MAETRVTTVKPDPEEFVCAPTARAFRPVGRAMPRLGCEGVD